MARSATDVMHDIILAAVMDAVSALKSGAKGLPNTLLRDINAITPNATFADLPPEVQAAITSSVRGAFNRLLREGYSVSPAQSAPVRTALHRPKSPAKPPGRGDAPPPRGPRPARPKGRGPGGR